MKFYKTTEPIWRGGLVIPVGTELWLSDAESKYIKHALEKLSSETTEAEADSALLRQVHEPVDPDASGFGVVVDDGQGDLLQAHRSRRGRRRIDSLA